MSGSTVDAVPGMQSGARLWNVACLLAYLPIFVLWPVLAALTTDTNYGGAAEALDWLPGIDTEGGVGSGVAALAWIGLPIAGLTWAMITFVPWLLSYVVFLPLGVLYLLASATSLLSPSVRSAHGGYYGGRTSTRFWNCHRARHR